MYHRTLKKNIEQHNSTLWNDLPYVWISIINMVQNAILLKVIHRFHVPMKALMTFLTETARNAKIHIKSKRPQRAKAIQNRRATSDLKLYASHSNKTKMTLAGEKKRPVHQWNTMEYRRRPKSKPMKLPLPNLQQRHQELLTENWISTL